MRSHVITSALAIALGVATPIVSAIGFPEVAVAQTVDERKVEADRLLKEATAQRDSTVALPLLEKALKLYQELRDRDGESSILENLGHVHNAIGNYAKAIYYHEKNLAIARIRKDRRSERKALIYLVRIEDNYNYPGSLTRRIGYREELLLIARAVNDQDSERNLLLSLGNDYNALSKYAKAIQYYEKYLAIISILEKSNNEIQNKERIGYKSLVLHYLRDIYRALGDETKVNQYAILIKKSAIVKPVTTDAIKFYEKKLDIARINKNRVDERDTLITLMVFYLKLDNHIKAVEYSEQILVINRELKDLEREESDLSMSAKIYSIIGNYSKSIDYYEQSLAIKRRKIAGFSDSNSSRDLSRHLDTLGKVYFHHGNYLKAIEYYEESLKINQKNKDRLSEMWSLKDLGFVQYTSKNYEEAAYFYQKALPIAKELEKREEEAILLATIGSALEKQKKTEVAIVFYKQSVNVYESIRQDIRTLPQETQQTYTKTIESTYRDLADLLLKADRILEAQQVLDLLKVQELNTYLSNVRGKTPELYELPPETEILKKYGEIQTTAIELGQKLTTLRAIPEQTRTKPQQQEIDRLVQLQIALNQQFNTFLDRPDIQKLVQALSPKTLRQTVDTASLDALRDDLKKLNAVLIYPLILDDRLELIITTPDSPPLRRTVNVKREELNQAITDFRTALQNPKKDAKPIAQKLYNWLIKPLEADLKSSKPKTLIYAPDAQLRYIPIAALHDGTQWLTERYAINHITAQSLTDLTAQPTKAPKILAGAIGNRSASIALGSDTFNFGGLAYTTKEVQSIQQLQPTTRILDGDAFSLNNVTPKLGDYNILHLATHASLVPKKVENSFILFGSSTYATLRDIESWTLNNFDLVVLSACETGLGGNFGTGGEEILGLGYQFQSRGAKATIASLWQVDDGGTQILMTAFYSALKQGHSKTKALQLAQTALIKNDFNIVGTDRAGVIRYISKEEILARSNHPAYWAPFILIGNGL